MRKIFGKLLIAITAITMGSILMISTWGSNGQTILATIVILTGVLLLGKTIPEIRREM